MTTYMFIYMYVLVFSLIQVQTIVMKIDGNLIADQMNVVPPIWTHSYNLYCLQLIFIESQVKSTSYQELILGVYHLDINQTLLSVL